ncbi:Ca2+-binding RTX toxin-like protein [Kibdelosporangium banguiense]|uniref:Ca2+-binding RTX toxin-like protein n=1 Tax=Kibdelosporangium banguiense TaxID=1365924 RepID=A0ABS4TUI1_9PSEU|nr:calcium-binding protein [Kibdelosporangium banguiense]MBP2328068.1 Ca2+-binding RTX toxin-like protein [Kibdelosporangium banguiense]
MRRTWIGAIVICAGITIIPAGPAYAQATCGGRPVTITGTAGDDSIIGTPADDVIAAGAGNDRVIGLGGNDIACLGAGKDFFLGGDGLDRLVAEAVPDGADVFQGGADHDTIDYSARTGAVRVSLDNIGDDGAAGESDNADLTVENIVGGAGDDSLTANQSTVLQGQLNGGPGNDTIIGSQGQDFLEGGDGADRIDGLGGEDILLGGAGDDTLNGGAGFDQVGGMDGNDILFGGPDGDIVGGGAGDDQMISDPTVDGGDQFFGFTGNDTVSYAPRTAGVTVTLDLLTNDGDTATGESDFISTDVENVRGSQAADSLTGSDQANTIFGEAGDDLINTVDNIAGNDRTDGGPGIDRCKADLGDITANCP